MRMVKMQQETLTLEEAVQKFLMEKDAQHTGAAAMTDYRNCLARFVKSSHNSLELCQKLKPLENKTFTTKTALFDALILATADFKGQP